ncbi:hypothetical protein GGD56_006827 [Rhizobium mongolense]|uniref:Uncharacterized protein n=2 Tax=Rhizobium mongolense TaxID=57676 RepID=A0ABR6IYC9_9HYPH|nr:hypothetical protein [Rhizobium mongolense]TVZ74904.1 hypothetical protein BCL32_0237 [Rhizobium mongolense USDA 1844]
MEGGRKRLSCSAGNANAVRRGRKLRMAVAGKRSRRSRSPIRHASSSPRRTWPDSGGRNHEMAALRARCPVGTLQRRTRRPVAKSHSVDFGRDGPGRPGSCFHLSTRYRELAIRRLEDLCVGRQSRLSSKSSSPEATNPKPSIWGKLDLTSDQQPFAGRKEMSAVAGNNDRS